MRIIVSYIGYGAVLAIRHCVAERKKGLRIFASICFVAATAGWFLASIRQMEEALYLCVLTWITALVDLTFGNQFDE